MKAVFVVDVHASDDALEWILKAGGRYDAILVGGDLARDGSQQPVGDFLRGALSCGPPVFFVQGNADSPGTEVPMGVISLHGKRSTLGGHTIGGLGGSSPTPFRTPFELVDEHAEKVLSGIGPVDILLSHCPPAGTRCDRVSSGHVGSVPVRKYVETMRPVLVLSGHAHEGRAIDNLGGTTVVNPGPLMQGNYAEVMLGGVLSVELKSGFA